MQDSATVPDGPLDLLLPPSLDRAAAVELFAERLKLDVGAPRKLDRVLLDSFDGRLRSEGLRAEYPAGRGAAVTLALHEPGAPVRRAAVRRGARHLVEELPAGPVRERLADVLEERALLPVVRVRSAIQPLAVLDGDAKSVVRMAIERPEAVLADRTRVPLSPRVAVRRVLGYDRAYARTVKVLRDRLGLEPAGRSLFDEAALAAGRDPKGVASKPRIDLEAGMRADEAGRLALKALHGIAEANLPGTLEDLDTEFLHDLRVSIRRARSVLRELDGVFDPDRRQALRDELKWAQQLTGPVRDLDVQLLEWNALVAPLPADRVSELAALRAVLARRRARELTRMRRGLRTARFTAALRAWESLATDGEGGELAGEPIESVAGARIRKVYRRMVRDGSSITDDSHPEELHDLRKRGKELRYLLELFGGPFPSDVVKPMVSSLKDLQDVLGRFQDRAVQVEALRELRGELAAEPEGPAALIALGPALDALEADQAGARAHFAERFAAFASPEQRKTVRDTFPK